MRVGSHATPRPLFPRARDPVLTVQETGLAGLDVCGKSRPPPGVDPRNVQPVASSHTDYAIPDRILKQKRQKYDKKFKPTVHVLSHIKVVYILPSYLFKLRFTIFFPTMHISFQGSAGLSKRGVQLRSSWRAPKSCCAEQRRTNVLIY
jgi:hypothetical protein